MQLVINAGSSSLKWALFAREDSEKQTISGVIDSFGDKAQCKIGDRIDTVRIEDHSQAVHFVIDFLKLNGLASHIDISSVVHRVVHGGEKYYKPTVINEEVIKDIEALSSLAPLHNPVNLAGIRACIEQLPDARQVAIFDTAFHHSIAREVFLYGIPWDLYEKFHIRKYGFHGISHSFMASKLRKKYGKDVDAIVCHLGSGSSITALHNGRSVDTTMGFTPLDGVLMATRTGDLDPDIPLFLLREGHYSVEELEELFSKRSGLYGISGHSDLREIWDLSKKGDARCRLALDMLCYRIAYYVSALKVNCPNLQAVVFTGGIGEKAWYVRERVCELLRISVSENNKSNAEQISSEPDVFVWKTDEQLQMHHLAKQVL